MTVRIEPMSETVRVVVDHQSAETTEQQDAQIEIAWRDLCARNPRYFNGTMLAFDSYDAGTGVVRATVEQYKRHAVRDVVDVGISLLAITGLLIARDDQGCKNILLGKRSPNTHRYGNLWEFGPSGGIDVPVQPARTLGLKAIVREIERETMEECGIAMTQHRATPIAMVHDEAVGSTDLAIMIELGGIPPIEHGWEYLDSRWVDADALERWAQCTPNELIPTTLALVPAVLSLMR